MNQTLIGNAKPNDLTSGIVMLVIAASVFFIVSIVFKKVFDKQE